MVRSSARSIGLASGLALCVAFPATPASADGGGAGWRMDEGAATVIAMSAMDLINLGTTVVNLAYLGDSEMPRKVAILSYVGGAGGLVAGGLGAANGSGAVKAFGAATFGLAALTIGLTTWNITRPGQEEQQPALVMAPSSMVDSEGRHVPAAGVAGVF